MCMTQRRIEPSIIIISSGWKCTVLILVASSDFFPCSMVGRVCRILCLFNRHLSRSVHLLFSLAWIQFEMFTVAFVSVERVLHLRSFRSRDFGSIHLSSARTPRFFHRLHCPWSLLYGTRLFCFVFFSFSPWSPIPLKMAVSSFLFIAFTIFAPEMLRNYCIFAEFSEKFAHFSSPVFIFQSLSMEKGDLPTTAACNYFLPTPHSGILLYPEMPSISFLLFSWKKKIRGKKPSDKALHYHFTRAK